MTFVDTSALLAFVDGDDEWHESAVAAMEDLLAGGGATTHSYVVVETEALVHRRLGSAVARKLLEDVIPALSLVWVDEDLHGRAVATHLRGLRRGSSLVDHVSFELMRRRSIRSAFAFDRDFGREGFTLVPAQT